jgi:hypothetical protein
MTTTNHSSTMATSSSLVQGTAHAETDAVQAQKLSRLEGLDALIRVAMQESEGLSFDYRSKEGNKEARSYIARLRKINGSIEKARVEAKSIHMARAKNVDNIAKILKGKVDLLIKPHETSITAIEVAERARVDNIQHGLQGLQELAYACTTVAGATANLRLAQEIKPEDFEEFAEDARSLKDRAIHQLEETIRKLQIQEVERAELERLRAEAAERERAEREEALRREGERRAAEELAQQQQAEIDRMRDTWRQTLQQTAEAQARDARQAAKAEARAAEAIARALEAERQSALLREEIAQRQAASGAIAQQDPAASPASEGNTKASLFSSHSASLFAARFADVVTLNCMKPKDVGHEIAYGEFMDGAVVVDWQKFNEYMPRKALSETQEP